MKSIHFDSIDAKILRILLLDSRTSFTRIAKQCGISVGTARTRYQKLKKTGLIKEEIMHVNPYSLGYMCIGSVGIITPPGNEEPVIEYLNKIRLSIFPVLSLGKYNMWLLVAKRNIEEWVAELRRIESNPHIKHIDSMIWTNPTERDHPENLEIKTLNNTHGHCAAILQPAMTEIADKEIEIDEMDRKIARILVSDSRIPFRKIAKELNISTKQVIQRYKRLRTSVLPVSTISVDLEKLGYQDMVFFFVKGEASKRVEISSKILRIRNMLVLINLMGPYDLLVLAALEDLDAFIRLEKEIRAIQGIEQVDSFVTDLFLDWPRNLFKNLLY